MPALLWVFFIVCGRSAAGQDARTVHDQYRSSIQSLKQDTSSVNRLLSYGYDLTAYDGDSALALFGQAGNLSNTLNYTWGKGKSRLYSGIVYSDRGLYDSAQQLYEQALSIFNADGNELEMGKVYNNLANLCQYQDRQEEAMDMYLKSVAALERANARSYLARLYGNISVLFQTLKQYPKSIEYSNKAEAIAREFGDTVRLANALISRAVSFNDLGRRREAFPILLEAMHLSDRMGYLIGRYMARQNLADFFAEDKLYDSALYYLRAGEPFMLQSGDPYYLAGLYLSFSKVYTELKAFAKAENYAMKAVNIARPLGLKNSLQTAYEVLTVIYTFQTRKTESLEAFRQYKLYTDSVRSEEMTTRVNVLETRFRTLQKDKEIDEKELALLQKNVELKRKNNWIRIAGGSIVILLVLGGIGGFYYRQKQLLQAQKILTLQREQEVKVLQAMIQGEEQERSRIARDLHDGVGSMLSAARLKMDALGYHSSELTLQASFRESLDLLKGAVMAVRETAHNLQPVTLQEHGLHAAVEAFCRQVNGSHGLVIEFQAEGERLRFNRHFELLLYRTVQELINNVIKHAHATRALVQLATFDDLFSVTVEDNGQGFDPATAGQSAGMGIADLQERVGVFGGKVQIDSSSSGTSVVLDFGLDAIVLQRPAVQ